MSGEMRRHHRRGGQLCRKLRRALLLTTTPQLLLSRPLPPGSLPFVRHFTNKEIKRATKEFSMIIKSCSDGAIFKGQFPDGLVAAVKKLRASEQGKDTFYREVQLLGRLHHRHIVTFRGFSEGRDRFLVFDCVENGSLKDFLHDPLRTPLNWRSRLQIAIDVAAALEYLQFFCDPPLYNVSINSDNVLLDENFVAKLSSIGLLGFDSHHMLEVDAACSEDHISRRGKHIISQFGVLILELITGQSFESEGAELIQWVQQPSSTCSLHNMVDADLGNSYDLKELRSLLIIARLCTKSREPTISISQILRYLQRKAEHSVLQV